MPNRILTLEQAARHIHVEERDLIHLAQRGEIEYRRRGDEYFFVHRSVDDWAQRNIMTLEPKSLTLRHRAEIIAQRKPIKDDRLFEALIRPEWIKPDLQSRTRPGVIRDMVALAQATGILYDDVILQREVEEREKISSTAVGEGVALLHPRYQDPYYAASSFFVLGKTVHPIFYGAQDGKTTDVFFLLCCVDDSFHLHLLARLCLLLHGGDLADKLRAAETSQEMYDLLLREEETFLNTMK